MAHVFQINASHGGVPKRALASAEIDQYGIVGDHQTDQEHHGGPERALCLFALERILALQEEGHPIFPGSTGENITVVGLDWDALQPGDRLRVGEVELAITRHTTPCQTIAGSFRDGAFTRIAHKLHPGWSRVYARVLRPGRIRPGDPITHLDA